MSQPFVQNKKGSSIRQTSFWCGVEAKAAFCKPIAPTNIHIQRFITIPSVSEVTPCARSDPRHHGSASSRGTRSSQAGNISEGYYPAAQLTKGSWQDTLYAMAAALGEDDVAI
ncbi:hypothetical protein XFF6991_150520 [Xanthomonas phaseoli pv. phaseoli]|uniref:Uncharacterized protein n=1 Tax=Xanthomonas campestris pv. phaseoli TaxID=317013 RepID=A0A7Z7NGK1_XANCH|nr:hypothetical protein XFF6991_150520 [Xanthomonas phaseoli pv. phaseoli]